MSGALPFPLPFPVCVIGNEGISRVEMYSSSLGSDTGAASRARTCDKGMGVCGPRMRVGGTRVTVEEEAGCLYDVDADVVEEVSVS